MELAEPVAGGKLGEAVSDGSRDGCVTPASATTRAVDEAGVTAAVLEAKRSDGEDLPALSNIPRLKASATMSKHPAPPTSVSPLSFAVGRIFFIFPNGMVVTALEAE